MAQEKMQALVDKFNYSKSDYTKYNSIYNETQLRVDFINHFLNILGWDVYNEKKAPQNRREVVHEDTIEIEEGEDVFKRSPDYTIRFGTERKFFIEVKRPSLPIISNKKAAFQLRRYGWNAGLKISVLTNFEKLIIYDCIPRPKADDDPKIARLSVYDYTDYISKFEEIYNKLSYTTVRSGQFDSSFGIHKKYRSTEPFDKYFLVQIERWRELIAQDIIQQNPTLSQVEINFLVQRLINRIVFLRICEDRELEKYKALQQVKTYSQLKKLFLNADKRYDSGLFDFIEDKLSLKIHISDEILVNIFKELYYPESPYAFSVVEANVLGDIYELFLAKEVRVVENTVKVLEKPEVIESHGVVPTPKYIVDEIIDRTLKPLFYGKSPNQLKQTRIADISCGSGTFLIGAYEYLLNYYLEWYLNQGVDKYSDKIYEGKQGIWRLSLDEKKRILLAHIYGVDIDEQAVEVTCFSLLLKVLENEHKNGVYSHIRGNKHRLLPDLRQNIKCGNSLTDSIYFKYDCDALSSNELMRLINPLDWNESFHSAMRDGGFDAIVGNPPYVRIQNMVRYSPKEIEYYKDSKSPYTCARSYNFDKYSLFIERGISLLKPTGRLGYIVPHKFFTLKSGRALRHLLSNGRYLEEIVHFGALPVFGKSRSNYTCILILNKIPNSEFTVEYVYDLNSWRLQKRESPEIYKSSEVGDRPWEFILPQAKKLFERLRVENPKALKDIAHIFVGVQTSDDPIYIIKPTTENETFVTFTNVEGVERRIERSILRPCLYNSELKAFGRPKPNFYIIFPYTIADDKAILYTKDEMIKGFPECWNYLNEHKERLIKRNIQNYTEGTWYRFGRSQSLTKFLDESKLIWPVLSLGPRYAYDDQNIVFTGGGNGPYYALRPKKEASLSIYYLQAVLSHPVFEAMIKARPSLFRGNYISHGKQFIEDIPIHMIDFSNPVETNYYNEIIRLMQQLITTAELQERENVPQSRNVLAKKSNLLQQKVQEIINYLYSISQDEIKDASGTISRGEGDVY